MTAQPSPSLRSLRALDAVNFCLADVMTGVGPFMATYLQADRHWDPARVGVALSAAGIASVVVQTPAGAVIDGVRSKRALVGVAGAMVALAGLAAVSLQPFAAVIACQVLIGAGIFGVVWVLIVSDLAHGTGRFNALQGFVATCWGLGAALSPLAGGWVAKAFGYQSAFFFLAGLGLAATLVFALAMPETGKRR